MTFYKRGEHGLSLLFIMLLSLFSHYASAEKYGLGFSFIYQSLHNDNYLLTEKHQPSLYGDLITPTLNFDRKDEKSHFNARIQAVVERYNREVFNDEHPRYTLDYKYRGSERLAFELGYGVTKQATRISELQDSGLIDTVPSSAVEREYKAAMAYQLSEKDSLSINAYNQQKIYDSDLYADLNNRMIQSVYDRRLSERLNVNGVLLASRYKSNYVGYFPLLPLQVTDRWICPPDTLLVNNTCVSFEPAQGYARNESESYGSVIGFSWQQSKQLSLSGKAGETLTETVQTISLPKISAIFGPPIEQELVFGGRREQITDVKSKTAELSLSYAQERSEVNLSWGKQVQPSSTGSLWNLDNYRVHYLYKVNDKSRITFSLSDNHFTALDEAVLDNSNGDRRLAQGELSYAHQFTLNWSVNINLQFVHQSVFNQRDIDAESLQGFISLTYGPPKWTW